MIKLPLHHSTFYALSTSTNASHSSFLDSHHHTFAFTFIEDICTAYAIVTSTKPSHSSQTLRRHFFNLAAQNLPKIFLVLLLHCTGGTAPWPRTKWQGRIERRVCGFMTGNKKSTRVHFPHPQLGFQTENKMMKCQSLHTNYVHNSATYSCNCRAYLRPVDIIKAILARPTTLSCTMVPWEACRSFNYFILPLSLFYIWIFACWFRNSILCHEILQWKYIQKGGIAQWYCSVFHWPASVHSISLKIVRDTLRLFRSCYFWNRTCTELFPTPSSIFLITENSSGLQKGVLVQ